MDEPLLYVQIPNPDKREISRDSFQYSLDGYKYLHQIILKSTLISAIKTQKIISEILIGVVQFLYVLKGSVF